MKVVDVPYKFENLNTFAVNDLYRKCQRELTDDFEKVYADFLNHEIPEDANEATVNSFSDYKTALLSAFVSGHLNFADPSSKFFIKFNNLLGPNEEKKSALSGLILPDHLRT